jgi:hypothetical protein
MTKTALAITHDDDVDGFSVTEKSSGTIRGKIVKFNDLDKAYVADKVLKLDPATQYVVLDVVTAWVKWGKDKDGKPVPEHRTTQPGALHPGRDELPDQDKTMWPPGQDGKPRDPWRDSRYLYFVDMASGSEYTFVTDSYGGRRAIGDLKSAIMNMRSARPGALPLIVLESVPWKTQHGVRPRPHFEIIGWRDGARPTVLAPSPQPKPTALGKPALVTAAASLAGELDDDIPFD